jgi:phosphatidylserine/phosphatidylglycerophosphate/cardiolipin synthase-like enzyme
MASGINEPKAHLTVRETVELLRSRHKLTERQALSAVYVLLESGALAEESGSVRFLDARVSATVPLDIIDSIVGQIAANSCEAPSALGTNSNSDVVLAATLPPGLAVENCSIESQRGAFSKIIGSSRKTLRISSPYIEKSGLDLLFSDMESAAKQGVQLRLLTRIDDRSMPDTRKILAILALYELFGENIDVRSFQRSIGRGQNQFSFCGAHAKILIADNNMAYAGSGEMREQSLSRNFEVGFLVKDAKTVKEIALLFDGVWNLSTDVSLNYCKEFIK